MRQSKRRARRARELSLDCGLHDDYEPELDLSSLSRIVFRATSHNVRLAHVHITLYIDSQVLVRCSCRKVNMGFLVRSYPLPTLMFSYSETALNAKLGPHALPVHQKPMKGCEAPSTDRPLNGLAELLIAHHAAR